MSHNNRFFSTFNLHRPASKNYCNNRISVSANVIPAPAHIHEAGHRLVNCSLPQQLPSGLPVWIFARMHKELQIIDIAEGGKLPD